MLLVLPLLLLLPSIASAGCRPPKPEEGINALAAALLSAAGMLARRNTESADEVYSSLHGCTVVLLVLSILHCLMLSGVLGITVASMILCCASRPGTAGIYASGKCFLGTAITCAAVAGVSCIIALALAISSKSLQPPIAEACVDCEAMGGGITGSGQEQVVPFGALADFEATGHLISEAAARTRENLTSVPGQASSLLASEPLVPFGALADYPFSSGLADAGRAIYAVLSPLTPLILSAEKDTPVVRGPKVAHKRRLKTCIPESGPLEGQSLTKRQCEVRLLRSNAWLQECHSNLWSSDPPPLLPPSCSHRCSDRLVQELMSTTQATFFWCFFNSLFEMGIFIFACLVAYKLKTILSLVGPALAPYSESSNLMKR